MPDIDIVGIIAEQREFFASGKTLDVKWRKEKLAALRTAILAHEKDIADALYADLGKSCEESYMCEIGIALSELSSMIKNIEKYARRQKVKTPLSLAVAQSYILPSPYGSVLIMSPWNYPFLLSVQPLIEAVAAGNTVILKTSRFSPATASAIETVLGEVFDRGHVFSLTGGREINAVLIESKFDYVFFTGGKTVGKLVYTKAAENMTPVTLELGGKSPTIVDRTADLETAARRIVFGKYLNAGQTCVAPDYLWCDASIKDELIRKIKAEINSQFPDALRDDKYGKIITQKHFERLIGLIEPQKTVIGGKGDEASRKIEPTVMDNVTFDDAVMGEEIFGPILPVLTFDDLDEVIKKVNEMPEPLALYFFSSDAAAKKKVMENCRFGGGCVNDVIMHLATPYMGFGGFGASGMGAYHGKTGFDTFTHYKGIVDKSTFIDPDIRYRPYSPKKTKWVKRFLK